MRIDLFLIGIANLFLYLFRNIIIVIAINRIIIIFEVSFTDKITGYLIFNLQITNGSIP